MKNYWSIFRKVACAFLIVYVVMMGVFTVSEQMDVRREYRNYTSNVLRDAMDEVKRIVEEYENPEDEIRELNLRLTRQMQFTEEFQVYAAAKVALNAEYIAQTGSYLYNGGLDNNLEPIPGGEKYINLGECLSDKELTQFVRQCIERERDENKAEIIEAKGYVKGAEMMPQILQYYTIDKKSGEHAWYDENAILRQTYEVDVVNKEGLLPYEGDFWRLCAPVDIRVAMPYQMTKKVQMQLEQLEETILQWNHKQGWDRKKKFWQESYTTYQVMELNQGFYGLGYAVAYYPWQVAVGRLTTVYIFSAIVMLVMTLILVQGMWDTYKKQQLLEMNRRMLVDAIAHELKTPLGIIQAYSEGLKEQIAEHKREHYLDVIVDETVKMNTLIIEMLELSKLESKAYKLKEETFSMKMLIENQLKYHQKLIEDKKIQLLVQIEDIWEVTADYKGMERVISNLLSNAIEHTGKGQQIIISIEAGKVAIENEGVQIPEEKLSYIWDSFYKVEDINNRSGNRSGLGLAIVRNLLELHHMPYGAMNTNRGVKFWFEILHQ